MAVSLVLDGREVRAVDEGGSLLDVLREELGVRSAKDGCSPQGQCGCCTVLVDGAPRVACVTPVRRVAGREVTTIGGLPEARRWAEAFAAHGASQCGFCTPGIIVRLVARARRGPLHAGDVEDALVAHLCRCTGWRTIVDAALVAGGPAAVEGGAVTDAAPRRPRESPEASAVSTVSAAASAASTGDSAASAEASARRAGLEGRSPQRPGAAVALGEGGFADDAAPPGALVAVPDGAGGWAVGPTTRAARAAAGKVQGRRSTVGLTWPVDVPAGDWHRTLQTTWVEPAYLEPDASWCEPGGEPASSLANGGAFGGKRASPLPAAARALADEHGRPVRALWSREDVVRYGPKRPPLAAGVRADGTGVVRVARTPGIADAIASVAPGLVVEEVDVPGPPTSAMLRGAGWAEAAVLLAGDDGVVVAPWGAWAAARVGAGGIDVRVGCGEALDEVVLSSYCTGAAHQALGWVTSEGIAVGADGAVHDLTIRSFGILRAPEMPRVRVEVAPAGEPPPGRTGPAPVEPVNGSDAVFAAVAAAVWVSRGRPSTWPIDRKGAT
jgi:aerobic-type carbon monoxide dehydrogenase small subunit (CoxS/CutS family)